MLSRECFGPSYSAYMNNKDDHEAGMIVFYFKSRAFSWAQDWLGTDNDLVYVLLILCLLGWQLTQINRLHHSKHCF